MARGSNRQARRDSLGGLSQAQFARRKGVSREAVRKAVEAGRIPTLKNGRIDPRKADAALLANTDPARAARAGLAGRHRAPRAPRPRATGDVPKYADSKARREHYLAELAQLEYEERQLRLLPAEAVRQKAFETARRVRDQLQAVPDRVARTVLGMTDAAEIRGVIAAELRRVCDELGAGPEGDVPLAEQAAAQAVAPEAPPPASPAAPATPPAEPAS